MVQVTSSKPRELDKMNEEKRVKETPAGGTAPKPELQTVRFDWTGAPVAPSSDVLVYKPNQRRPGELSQATQPVPAIWLPSPHGAPWQYSGLAENGLANGLPAAPPPLGWYATRHVFACGGLMILLLVFMLSYLDRYRLLSMFRPKRSRVQNTLKVICQVRDDTRCVIPELPTKLNDSVNVNDKPPSYSKYPDLVKNVTPKVEKPNENDICTCVLSTGKNKVPRVMFFDTRKDQKAMEELGLNKSNGQAGVSQQTIINVPTQADPNDPQKEAANFVIEINDTATESGCVIGLDVFVDQNSNDTVIIEERRGEKGGPPFCVIVEQLNHPNNTKNNKKNDGAAKK